MSYTDPTHRATGAPPPGAPLAGGTPGTVAGSTMAGSAMSGSTAATPPPPRGAEEQRSLGEIVSDVTSDLSTLLKQEMDLAKAEIKQEMSKAGKGAGLLGGAGVAGHMVLVFLSLTITFLLDLWMPLWAAALIVTALWGIAAAVLAMIGRKALKESNPQLPRTQQTLKEDAEWAKAQKS